MKKGTAMGLYVGACAIALIFGRAMADASNGLSGVYLIFLTAPGSLLGALMPALGPGTSLIWISVAFGFLLNLSLIHLIFRARRHADERGGGER